MPGIVAPRRTHNVPKRRAPRPAQLQQTKRRRANEVLRCLRASASLSRATRPARRPVIPCCHAQSEYPVTKLSLSAGKSGPKPGRRQTLCCEAEQTPPDQADAGHEAGRRSFRAQPRIEMGGQGSLCPTLQAAEEPSRAENGTLGRSSITRPLFSGANTSSTLLPAKNHNNSTPARAERNINEARAIRPAGGPLRVALKTAEHC